MFGGTKPLVVFFLHEKHFLYDIRRPFATGYYSPQNPGRVCRQLVWHPMNKCAFRRANGKTTAVIAALLVCLLAPGAVHAGCGDHIRMVGKGEHAGHSRSHPEASSRLSQNLDDLLPTKFPPPCSGPMCSRGRQLPPSAPPAPAPVELEEWGCAVPFLDAIRTQPVELTSSHSTSHALRRGCDVYHPPR